jgi:hypothetical protein
MRIVSVTLIFNVASSYCRLVEGARENDLRSGIDMYVCMHVRTYLRMYVCLMRVYPPVKA